MWPECLRHDPTRAAAEPHFRRQITRRREGPRGLRVHALAHAEDLTTESYGCDTRGQYGQYLFPARQYLREVAGGEGPITEAERGIPDGRCETFGVVAFL
jgi:hypothetical protein